jgi:hypothetical protein
LIHMLSKFDLAGGENIQDFHLSYDKFVDLMRDRDLVDGTGKIGRRVVGSPMDTAGPNEPEFYSVMSFRDRKQLDAAYAYMLDPDADVQSSSTHRQVNKSVTNAVFTCWQDLD